MLVNCPKCGFSQPEDQYCAKCGIDMRHYEPPKVSFKKRVLKHPLFPVIVLIPLIWGYFEYKKMSKEREVQKRVEYLTGAEPQNTAEKLSKTSEESAAIKTRDTQQKRADLPAESTELPAEKFAEDSAAAAETMSSPSLDRQRPEAQVDEDLSQLKLESSGTSAAKVVPRIEKPALTVIFAEVSNDFVQSLIQQGSGEESSFRDFGDYMQGSFPKLQEMVNKGLQQGLVRVLDRSTRNFENDSSELRWFSGAQNTNRTVGVSSLIALNGQENRNIFAEMDLIFSLPRAGNLNDLSRDVFSASFTLKPSRGFYLTGMLPPPQSPPGEPLQELYSQGVLKILLNQEFQARRSEFAVFIFLNEPEASTQPPESP